MSKSQDLVSYFHISEKKTSISTDQIDHLIESADQRTVRTVHEYFDSLHVKSIRNLSTTIDTSLNIMISTIEKLRIKLQTKREELKNCMNVAELMESLIDEEYIILRNRYSSLLTESLSKSNIEADNRLKIQIDKMKQSIDFSKRLRSYYIDKNTHTNTHSHSTNNNNSSNNHRIINLKSLDENKLKPNKSIAQINNENSLNYITKRLNQTNDIITANIKTNFDIKLNSKLKYIKNKTNILNYCCNYQLTNDNYYYNLLINNETLNSEIIDELSNELMKINDILYEFHLYNTELRCLPTSRRKKKKTNEIIKVKTCFNETETIKLGSHVKMIAKLSDMSTDDIIELLEYIIPENSLKTFIHEK